jgi:photosystem II stability/assembly factor-like uncharacterized protein
MKKILTFLVFLIVAGYFAESFAQPAPEWKWIHPKPQGQYLTWIKMIDANTWFAAGNYGTFMKTTNAGANWRISVSGYGHSLYPGSGIRQNNLTGYFFDANTGFLGVQSVRGIAKTTNGGESFDTIQILASGSGSTNGFYFLNTSTGYLSGNTGFKLMKTTNAGINWNFVTNVPNATYYSVYAPDTNNILGTSSSGNVYLTTNAGVNWTTSNVGTTNTLYRSNFINASTGYVCGSNGLFRYTTNGGVNWTGTNPPTTSSLYSIVVEGSDVYVSGYTFSTQDLFKTTDNGTTWTSISYTGASTITNFNAYSFDKNGNNMMVVGTYGEMIKSSNNGANWNSIMYRRSLANMGSLYANSTGRVIAMGTALMTTNAIIYSTDGGENWASSNLFTYQDLSHIDMLNSNTGWISGRFGAFFKTTNGGVSWDTSMTNNPVTSPYFGNGVNFINENTGWIVGGLPSIGGVTKIFKTTNGGVNWFEQTPANSGPIGTKIDMYNANTGYMAHSTGIQKTINSGDNWTLTSTIGPSGTSYTPIKTVDSLTVYTGGSNTQVYGTTNGGVTWDSLNFPVKAGTIFCTDWYDKNNGVAGAVIGVVGITTNRGATWQIYNTGGYTTYQVKMVHPDTVYAVSGNTAGAQVFKYAKGFSTGGFTYETSVPENYSLKQNYPNPFNPVTTIEFSLPSSGIVSLKIYDIAGREYSTEISGMNLNVGNYKMNFNGSNLSSGVYFYSLVVNGKVINTKKMILVK